MKKLIVATMLVSLALVGCGTPAAAPPPATTKIAQPESWKPVSGQSYIMGKIINSTKSNDLTNVDVEISKIYGTGKDKNPIFKAGGKVRFRVSEAPKFPLNKGDNILLLQNQVSEDGKSSFFSASIVEYTKDGKMVDSNGNPAQLPADEPQSQQPEQPQQPQQPQQPEQPQQAEQSNK